MRRLLSLVVGAALLTPALAGCSLGDALRHERQGSASSVHALGLAWRTPASPPDWVPADATGIRFIAGTRGPADRTPAAVRVRTRSALPDACAEAPRPSAAAFDPPWAPDLLPDRVERCGNWAVVPVVGGWFGWTPLDR